jgi:hypothetical protein
MDEAPSMKSMNALEDLLEGSQSYWWGREKLSESGAGERCVNDGNPFWSGLERIAFILLIYWTAKPRILALVLDVTKPEDLWLWEKCVSNYNSCGASRRQTYMNWKSL